ncbi:MAG: trigger factor [Thermodesulfovibrionales bacterium]
MLKHIEDVSSTRKALTIEIPADVLENKIQSELKKAQKNAKIPGFRPGKTPMSIIEKKFGKAIEAEVLEEIIPQYFESSIKEANISPVSAPNLLERFDFQRNKPLVLKIGVDVLPHVEDLKYEGIKVKDIPVDVKAEDVERVLNSYALRMAEYEISQDEIQIDDLVTFNCSLEDKNVDDVVMKVGSQQYYPTEFTDAFIGKKSGDDFQLQVDFPDDKTTPLSGIKGTVSIQITSVKKRKIPTIDDELAKDLGFENLDNLKEKVHNHLVKARTESSESIKINQIANTLLKNHNFDLPETLINEELSLLVDMERAKNKDKSEDELRKELYEQAVENVKLFVLIELIGKKEGVEVSKEEMEQSLLKMSQRFNVEPEALLKYIMEKDGSLAKIHYTAFRDKVFKILLDKAEKETITPDEKTQDNKDDSPHT